jgi:hypothetical protein
MQEFNKVIEEERKDEPLLKKTMEELTEQEKEEVNTKRAEESIRKIKEFDKFMKETPKIIYNTNVFKNVKLAMTEDEIKVDET